MAGGSHEKAKLERREIDEEQEEEDMMARVETVVDTSHYREGYLLISIANFGRKTWTIWH